MATKLMSVSGAAEILDLSEDVVPESNSLRTVGSLDGGASASCDEFHRAQSDKDESEHP